jgi:hypothetical protein
VTTIELTSGDHDLIVAFAGCSLDDSPGSNWVQGVGGLPSFICEIARAIKRTGKSTQNAIQIAVSRVKVWASGKGVSKDTQAKAAKAVAEWEAKKAKSKAKTKAKDTVKASVIDDISDADLLRIVQFEPKCELSAVQQIIEWSQRGEILVFAQGGDDKKKPYGDVQYADPKNNKYPIDTKDHVRAAWSYINQQKNGGKYSAEELSAIKSRIKAAAKKFGIDVNDD